jgi:hypothetical protein
MPQPRRSGTRSKHRAFDNADVAAVFDAYPSKVRAKLLILRELIFATASDIDGVGELEEVLRWGEPSYLTTESRSGSMIRINRHRSREGQYGIYFHCQTNLIASFKQIYPGEFVYEGNRAIVFAEADIIPLDALRHCVSLALTYRRDMTRGKRSGERSNHGRHPRA